MMGGSGGWRNRWEKNVIVPEPIFIDKLGTHFMCLDSELHTSLYFGEFVDNWCPHPYDLLFGFKMSTL